MDNKVKTISNFMNRILPVNFQDALTQANCLDILRNAINDIINAITTGTGVKAEELKTARKIELIDNIKGEAMFDGSKDIKIKAFLDNSCLITNEGWHRIAWCEDINTIKDSNLVLMYNTLNTDKYGILKFSAHHKQPMATIDFTLPQIEIDNFEIIGPVNVIKDDFKVVYWINPCSNKTEWTLYYNSHKDEITSFTEYQDERDDFYFGYSLEYNSKTTYDHFKGTELNPHLNFFINSIELTDEVIGKTIVIDKDVVINTKLSEKVKNEIKMNTLNSIKEGSKIKIDRTDKDIVINAVIKDYSLPIASKDILGGIKVGETLNITEDGILNTNESLKLPIASKKELGVIKVGNNLNIDEDGTLSAIAEQYNLPKADYDSIGGVKINKENGIDIKEDGSLSLNIASDKSIGGVKVGKNLSIDIDGTLNSITEPYVLPIASKDILGGIKVGDNLNIIDGKLNAIVNADFSKQLTKINNYYTNITIVDNESFIRGDIAYYNFKIRNEGAFFNANIIYKIGKLSVEPSNISSSLYGIGSNISTLFFTVSSGIRIDKNGDIFAFTNNKTKEIIVSGSLPITLNESSLPIPLEPPVVEDIKPFIKQKPIDVYNDLVNRGYKPVEGKNFSPLISPDGKIKVLGYWYPGSYHDAKWDYIYDSTHPMKDYHMVDLEMNYTAYPEMRKLLNYVLDEQFVETVMSDYEKEPMTQKNYDFGDIVVYHTNRTIKVEYH